MTTTAEMRAATQALTERAKAALAAFAATLDYSDPEAARDAFLAFVPLLVARYGDISAAIAADWYEEQRERAGVTSPFVVALAVAVPVVLITDAVRYAARHLWEGDPSMTAKYLEGTVQKYALQPGRDTIAENAVRDPQATGWVREARPNACEFCTELAGQTYATEAGAAFEAHTHCHCVAVPVFD